MKKLEEIFGHRIFKMLFAKGRITRALTAMLSSWRHSGFLVFCGNRRGPQVSGRKSRGSRLATFNLESVI